MADEELQPITIDVPLFAGQNSASDPRVIEPGALPLVQNGRLSTNGQNQKRYGTVNLSQLTSTGATIATGRQVFSAGNALFLHDGNNLYVYNAANDLWVLIGGLNAATVQNVAMAQSLTDVAEVSSAATANAVAIAWREGTALKLSVYSPSDGIFFQAATVLCVDGSKPNVVAVGTDFAIAYCDNSAGDLKLTRVAGTALATVGTSVSVTAALTSNQFYDICIDSSSGTPHAVIAAREADSISTPVNFLTENQATGTDSLTNTTGFTASTANASYGDPPGTGVLSSSTTMAWQGTRSLKMVGTGSGFNGDSAAMTILSLAAGTYTASVYIRTAAGQGSAGMYWRILRQAGVTTTGATVTAVEASWTRVTVTFTIAAPVNVQLNVGGLTAGALTYHFDGFQLEVGSSATTWISPTPVVTPQVIWRTYDAALTLLTTYAYITANWGADTRLWCFALTATAGQPYLVVGDASFWAFATDSTVSTDGTTPEVPFSTSNVRRIYGTGTAASNVCWIETSSTAGGNTQIYLARYHFAAGSPHWISDSISYFTLQNCYFASRPFVADGVTYVWVLADWKLQTQLILLDSLGRAVGRALTNGNAAPSDGVFASLPSVTATVNASGGTNYFCVSRRRAQLKFDANGNVSTTIGATLVNLLYDNPVTQAVNVGGATYMSGAAPKLYDGRALTEIGFWFYSDTPTLALNVGMGALSAGSYSYALCYAQYDNKGRVWRSPVILVASGNATQPTGASGASITAALNDSVTISNISYIQSSAKANIFIEVYRTKANLTQFYKIAQIANVSALNSLTTTYVDALADVAITGELLYTDGAQPTYLAPPGFSFLTATPNRLYGLASETSEVWASALTSLTQPAQFLLGQTLGVPTLNANPIACELLDGQLYIFSDDAILTTGADGQVLSVTQTLQFAPPKALPVDAGCVSPGSVFRTEDGIWYQSAKGLMLLDRQQATRFVGENVKNYANTILSALSMPEQQQIRFVAGAQTLVYDYVFKRWSIYTGATPVSACRWLGSSVTIDSAGVVRREVTGAVFTDNGVHYSRTIETPWIKAAGINGYARCWRFCILGEARAAHKLQVRIAYQYDPAWVDTLLIDSTAVNVNGIYGGGLGPYGATENSIYGATPPAAYQFVGVMPRQKATSFKFEISDTNNSGTGEAAALTVLSLQCGVYGGLARLPASKGLG